MASKIDDALAVLDFHIADLAGQGTRVNQRNELIEARARVAGLIEAAKRTTAAFRAIGNHKAPAVPAALRIEVEAAILALDAAISTNEGGR